MTAPSLAPADTELVRLEAAATAIAANLVDLDGSPARKDLDKGPLTGRTAAAWADAAVALTQLWDGYRLLTDLITRARAVRDQKRLNDTERAEYASLVLGGSITLSTTTVPLAQRGLLGPGQVSTTCTPAALLSAMEAAFATAVGVATRAADVWQRLLPAAADAAAALATVRRLTGADTPTLAEAGRRLGAFTAALASDPLGCDERDLAAARTLIDRADAERTSADELRENLAGRLTDAHRLADEVAGAERAARAAVDEVLGRFADADIAGLAPADPARPDQPSDLRADLRTDLRPDLAAIEALARAGHWSMVSPRLHDWTRLARERLAALREVAARNTGMLAARNELRGRLDAYRAKALSRGLAEDATLGPLADAARTALYTAPCDVDAARAAVHAYQDALTTTLGGQR
jgi:hypothetical protein